MKKILLAMCGLVIILAGCANSDSKADETTIENGDIELKFVWWGGEERHEKTLEAIDLYNETHDGVTVVPEYYSYDGLNEKFPVMMVGGTEPDIMQVNYAWVYKFAGDLGEGFYDLNELSDAIGLENWSPEDLEPFTINGHLQAVPQGVTARTYGYNSAVLNQAGIKPPSTWDEVFEVNEQLKSKMGDDYHLLGDASNEKSLMYMMITYLTQELDKEFIVGDQLNFTADDLTLGFEFLQSLIDAGVLVDIQQDSREFDAENPNFINGQYTGILEWSSSVGKYEGNLPDGNSITIGDFISNTEQKKLMLKPSMGYAISKNTEYPEEAAEFINWMFTNREAIEILGTERGVPSNKVAYSILKEDGMLNNKDLQIEKMIDEADTLYLSPYYEEPNVVDAYDTALERFLYGETTPAEAGEEMYKGVSGALATM